MYNGATPDQFQPSYSWGVSPARATPIRPHQHPPDRPRPFRLCMRQPSATQGNRYESQGLVQYLQPRKNRLERLSAPRSFARKARKRLSAALSLHSRAQGIPRRSALSKETGSASRAHPRTAGQCIFPIMRNFPRPVRLPAKLVPPHVAQSGHGRLHNTYPSRIQTPDSVYLCPKRLSVDKEALIFHLLFFLWGRQTAQDYQVC